MPRSFSKTLQGKRLAEMPVNLSRQLRCPRRLDSVQHFRLEMRIPPQHLPILVTRDQSYLFDRESSFEEAACSFMPQVVKMKVVDVQVSAP